MAPSTISAIWKDSFGSGRKEVAAGDGAEKKRALLPSSAMAQYVFPTYFPRASSCFSLNREEANPVVRQKRAERKKNSVRARAWNDNKFHPSAMRSSGEQAD